MSRGIPRLRNSATSASASSALYAVGVRVMNPSPHIGGSTPPPENRL